MKSALAFEDRESREGFCYLLHLVEIILLQKKKKNPVQVCSVLRAKKYADSLKPLKLIKKGKFIYAASQQCRQIHI